MDKQVAGRSVLVFVALTALGFAVKAPFAAERFRLYPDAVAYVNIARNLAHGEGYVSTLKTSYFLPDGVTHCALPDWPPAYPLLAGALMRLGASEVGLQVANALLASLAAGIVFLITRRLFDRPVALLSGVVAAVAVNLFRSGTTAMSDPLGLVFALGAVYAVLRADERRGRLVAAGLLAGLAALTRYPNLILLPAMLAYVLVRERRVCRAISLLAGFAIVVAPFLAMKWVIYGSPLYSVQMFHYRTTAFGESAWMWKSGTETISASDHLGSVWRNASYFAAHLFTTAAGLQFLGVGLAVLLAKKRMLSGTYGDWDGMPAHAQSGTDAPADRDSRPSAGRALLLAVAVMSFAVYACTPSLPAAQGVRFMLLTWCLLVPFCAEGMVWLARRRETAMKVIAVATCLAAVFVGARAYLSPTADAMELKPLDRTIVRWLNHSVAPGTVVASNNPWLVSYHTGLPACSLPHDLDAVALRRFVSEQNVGVLLVLDSRRESRTTKAIRASREWFRVVELGRAWAGVPAGLEGGSVSAEGVTRGRAPVPGATPARRT
jgi:hypothetical protein